MKFNYQHLQEPFPVYWSAYGGRSRPECCQRDKEKSIDLMKHGNSNISVTDISHCLLGKSPLKPGIFGGQMLHRCADNEREARRFCHIRISTGTPVLSQEPTRRGFPLNFLSHFHILFPALLG